jgi:hypothetical protein
VTVTLLPTIGDVKLTSVARNRVTTYFVNVAPVTELAPHEDIVRPPSIAVAEIEAGAVGLVKGVIAFEAVDGTDVNAEFFAVTVNVLEVLAAKLLNVMFVSSVNRS